MMPISKAVKRAASTHRGENQRLDCSISSRTAMKELAMVTIDGKYTRTVPKEFIARGRNVQWPSTN